MCGKFDPNLSFYEFLPLNISYEYVLSIETVVTNHMLDLSNWVGGGGQG